MAISIGVVVGELSLPLHTAFLVPPIPQRVLDAYFWV